MTTIVVGNFDIIQQVRDTGIHVKVDEEQMKDYTRKHEASKWNWVPRSLLVRATTHICSSYVDLPLTRELWSRVDQKNKGKSICLSVKVCC